MIKHDQTWSNMVEPFVILYFYLFVIFGSQVALMRFHDDDDDDDGVRQCKA